MKTWRLPDSLRYPALILGLAVSYFGAARFGLLLQLPGTNASPVWPPSGIGLAAVLVFGLRAWPGIAIGAFLANLFTLPPTPAGLCAASLIAAGNTSEAIVALLVLRRVVPSLQPFDRPHDLLCFLATTAGACVVASTVGATSLWLTGVIDEHLYARAWFTWWLGDSAGILVLTPAVVCWWRNPHLVLSGPQWVEFVALVGTTALTAELTFGGWFPVAFPFVVVAGPLWAAFRFGPRETSLLPVLLLVITVMHVWRWADRMTGPGLAGVYVPFVSGASSINNALLMLQLFVCCVGATAAILAAAVAQRNQTEERLRDSELRFRTIFEHAGVGVALIDTRTGRFIRANTRYCELIGYSAEEMPRTTFMALTHPADLQEDLNQMQRLVTGEIGDFAMEKRLFRKDGRVVWINLTVSPMWRAGEPPEYHIAIVEDISDRKQAEERLRQSEAKLRLVTDHAPVLLVHCDAQRRYTFVNRPYAQRFGLEPGDVVGKTIPEVLGEPTHDRIREFVAAVLAGHEVDFEMELPVHRIGKRTMHCAYRPEPDGDGRVAGFVAAILDVTERVRAVSSLRESEQRFRLLTDALPHMVWIMRADRTLEYLNRRSSEFTGLTVEDVNAGGWGRLIHPDDLPGMLATASGPMERGEPHEAECRFRHYTGDYRWVVSTAVPVKDEAGVVVKWIGSTLDIHDRWLAERQLRELNATLERRVTERTTALRESEERFRSAFEYASIGMALVAPDGRWLQVNRSMCELVGYSEPELLATDFQSITHPEDLDTDLGHVREMLDRTILTYQMEKRYFHKLGHVVHALLSVSLVWDGNGVPLHFISQIQDITQRKRTEEQVRASLREKEVLLKEIHHRVKNNLQIVSTLLDLQSGHTADSQALEMFRESRERVKSMALIHERLYRSQDMARVYFAEYVRQLAGDLYRSYRVSDDIRLELDVDIPPLSIDIAIPCGLLLNELMSNCFKHAFKDARKGYVRVSLNRIEEANVLVVADSGVGFPADTDFRNTASFGLQLVNTLVAQLNGKMELTTERGTTVTVRFP